MEGAEQVTMEDTTRVTRAFGAARDAQHRRPDRVTVGIAASAETVRARLAASTVELAEDASSPRLVETVHAR